MRAGRWILSGIVIAGAGAGGWYYLGRGASEDAYLTAPARRGPIAASVAATGTVSPVITVTVGSQVSGQVAALYADFNSVVKKGQVIARLDPSNLEAQVARDRANLASSVAGLERAKAEAANAQRAFERAQNLKAQSLIPASDFDNAQAAAESAAASVKTAQAEIEQAKASLRISEVNLDHATILSPVDGIVISRNVDVGQTVAASLQAPTIFTIAQDLRRMQVHMNVAESDIGKLAVAQESSFTVDAYPETRFRGLITEIRNSPTTIQNVVTYEAVIDVDNSDLRLKPGMTTNISVTVDRRENALRVPNTALRFKPPDSVIAAMAKSKDGGGGAGGASERQGGEAPRGGASTAAGEASAAAGGAGPAAGGASAAAGEEARSEQRESGAQASTRGRPIELARRWRQRTGSPGRPRFRHARWRLRRPAP